MMDVLYLAWRYLAYYRLKTTVLVGAVATIVYLPVGMQILITQSAKELGRRADSTPLLIGAKGSPLELALNSLYFESDVPPVMAYGEVARAERSNLAKVIPLYTRFRAGRSPIVGTALEYFDFRGLQIASGRRFAVLGECVLGARAAATAGVGPDGHVLSSPENVFDIAGVYPLKIKVVGVLDPSGTPDDMAVFVDVKTAWVIQGLAHGHQDLSKPEAVDGVLRTEGPTIVANASVVEYNEITADNLSSFHFHGDPAKFPITAAIVVPHDEKSNTVLQGRYLGEEEMVQVVVPGTVMRELLDTVFTVRSYVMLGILILGVATLATMTMVFLLSLQLRRREIETMANIGGTRLRIASVLSLEILGVLGGGAVLALLLSACTSWFAADMTRALISMM